MYFVMQLPPAATNYSFVLVTEWSSFSNPFLSVLLQLRAVSAGFPMSRFLLALLCLLPAPRFPLICILCFHPPRFFLFRRVTVSFSLPLFPSYFILFACFLPVSLHTGRLCTFFEIPNPKPSRTSFPSFSFGGLCLSICVAVSRTSIHSTFVFVSLLSNLTSPTHVYHGDCKNFEPDDTLFVLHCVAVAVCCSVLQLTSTCLL